MKKDMLVQCINWSGSAFEYFILSIVVIWKSLIVVGQQHLETFCLDETQHLNWVKCLLIFGKTLSSTWFDSFRLGEEKTMQAVKIGLSKNISSLIIGIKGLINLGQCSLARNTELVWHTSLTVSKYAPETEHHTHIEGYRRPQSSHRKSRTRTACLVKKHISHNCTISENFKNLRRTSPFYCLGRVECLLPLTQWGVIVCQAHKVEFVTQDSEQESEGATNLCSCLVRRPGLEWGPVQCRLPNVFPGLNQGKWAQNSCRTAPNSSPVKHIKKYTVSFVSVLGMVGSVSLGAILEFWTSVLFTEQITHSPENLRIA